MATMRRRSRRRDTGALRGNFIETSKPEEIEIRHRFRERDQVQLDIQQLAIRIQKNGGVEIADRRVGRYVVKACFLASDLVEWIMENCATNEVMAVRICEEMWIRGLISHGTHRFRAFENSRQLFFRVAHPYTVDLLVTPSDLELLSRQLRGTSGPKLKDRLAYGKLIRHCFVASELVDWCISVHEIYPRERAIQIAQQLLDEGFIHNISGSSRFSDSSRVLCQHKDVYCGNVSLRGRLLEHLVSRFKSAYDTLAQERGEQALTVGDCVEIIKGLVQDCHDIKARYVLDRLLAKRRIEVITSSVSRRVSFSTRPILESTKSLSAFRRPTRQQQELSIHEIDNALDDNGSIIKLCSFDASQLSAPGYAGGSIGSLTTGFANNRSQIYERIILDPTKKFDLVGKISKREAQRRALRLLAQLSGATAKFSHASMTPLSRALKLLSKFTHLLMIVALAVEVSLGVTSTLALSTGVSTKFKTNGFAEVDTLSAYHAWLEASQLEPGFAWLGHQIALVEFPELLVGAPVESDCSDDALAQRLFRAREASVAGFRQQDNDNATLEGEPACFSDPTATAQGLALADGDLWERHFLLWQSENYTGSASQSANADLFSDLASRAGPLRPGRLALQLVALSAHTSPATLSVVRAIAHMGPYENEVLVRTTSVELESHVLACIFLWVSLFFCFVDFSALAWHRRARYLRSIGAVSTMTRMTLCLVGLLLQSEHVARTREFLEGVGSSRAAWQARAATETRYEHDAFEYLFNAGNASHTCLVISMFLTAVGLMPKFGGSRYDIFAIIMRTLGAVNREVEVIVLAFLANFVAFSMAAYAMMQSSAPEFKSPALAAITFFGSMFGGAPWRSFHANAVPSLLTGTTGFLLLGCYLFFSIFVLLSLFQALMLESFQVQKKQEYALNHELKEHMYADEPASSLIALKTWLLHNPNTSSKANAPKLERASSSGSRPGRGSRRKVANSYGFHDLALEGDPKRSTSAPKALEQAE